MTDLQRHIVPRGSTLPIDCRYRYSFGKPTADAADVPDGWSLQWIKADDPAPRQWGFSPAAVYIVDGIDHAFGSFDPNSGGNVVSYLYLVRDDDGMIAATWDEGRWWTPEESAAFLLMIRVPDTYVVAEGINRSGLNRRMRRRKR